MAQRGNRGTRRGTRGRNSRGGNMMNDAAPSAPNARNRARARRSRNGGGCPTGWHMMPGTGQCMEDSAMRGYAGQNNSVDASSKFGGWKVRVPYFPWTHHNPECFIAGTKVIMKHDSDKNIEDVVEGDEVLSYNVNNKQFEPKKVTELFTQTHNLKDGDITVKITFDDGTTTHNTIANPFWSKDKGFVAVDEERCNRVHDWVKQTNHGKDTESLEVGDTLFSYNEDSGKLDEVKVTDIEPIMEKDIRTYDIHVEDNHTFFADGILTHNSSPGGGPSGPSGPSVPSWDDDCTAQNCGPGCSWNSMSCSCDCYG